MAAERERDPKAKETMLQFAQLYLQFAQAAAALARAQFATAARSNPPN
jgi:hypothetical protein